MPRTSEEVSTYLSKSEFEQLRRYARVEDRSLASVLRQGLRAVGAVSAIPNENETPGGASRLETALAGAMSQKPNNGSGHAAAHISERLGGFGFYVFPIVPGSKVPATRRGLLDATRDPEKIKRFWAHSTRTTTSASDAARSQTSSSWMLMIAAGAWTVSMRSRLNMAPSRRRSAWLRPVAARTTTSVIQAWRYAIRLGFQRQVSMCAEMAGTCLRHPRSFQGARMSSTT